MIRMGLHSRCKPVILLKTNCLEILKNIEIFSIIGREIEGEKMKFYSYDYVLSQINQQNWLMVTLSALLLLVTVFFAFKAYRNKRDSKFRELAIISILSLIAIVLIGISTFQTNQASNNQFQTSLHFIEVISKDLGVDKSKVYVNTSAATDGAILKVGKDFYRAMSGSEPDKYLLEKIKLHKKTDIKLVEVKK